MIRLAIIAGVFVIAVAARWPSCGESFWVDELHTAWCIAGTFDQVVDRAAIGNQQPAYFGVLYLWRFCLPASVVAIYGTEAALRSTSVFLTSFSAAWLVAIVSGKYNRVAVERGASHLSLLVGGAAAGLALSLERNAIFFGTELRPYAAIMFLATAALALGRRLAEPDATRSVGSFIPPGAIGMGGCLSRVALHGVVLMAAAIHITSLIVLAPQMLIFAIGDVWQRPATSPSRRAVVLTHVCAGLAWGAVALWWLNSHLGLWQSRGNWGAFATVHGWRDVWQMWPWGALVLVPVAGAVIGCRLPGRSLRQAFGQRNVLIALLVLAGVIGSTVACYLLTAYAGIPLWHRRYLIAALPLLCASMGWLIGAIGNSGVAVAHRRGGTGRFRPGNASADSTPSTLPATLESPGGRLEGTCERPGFPIYPLGLAFACVLLLTYHQGTVAAWLRGESQLARRGENWSSAVAFIRRSATDGDQVWVDAGLIEQNGLPTLVADRPREAYLRYVTAGPYRLGEGVRAIGIGRGGISAWLDSSPGVSADPPQFLLTRRRSRQIEQLPAGIAGYRFGSVTVLIRR